MKHSSRVMGQKSVSSMSGSSLEANGRNIIYELVLTGKS